MYSNCHLTYLYEPISSKLVGKCANKNIDNIFFFNSLRIIETVPWKNAIDNCVIRWKSTCYWLKPTHPTSGGAVTIITNCCENCVKTTRLTVFGASRPCGPDG